MPAKPRKQKAYTLGSTAIDSGLIDLTCPSGGTCQVRRPGPQGLIKMGLLDSLDSLTSLIKTVHFDRVDGKATAEDIAEFAKNPQAVTDGLDLMQRIIVGVVVQPDLYMPPEHEADRTPGLIYVDQVDLEDQAFILQYVMGGTKDLESFRTQRAELLVNLQDGPSVPVPSE